MAFDPNLGPRGFIDPLRELPGGGFESIIPRPLDLGPRGFIDPLRELPGGGFESIIPRPLAPPAPPPIPQDFFPGTPSGFAPRASLPSFGGFGGVPSIPSPPPFSGFFAQGDPFRRGLQRPPFFGGQSQQPFFGQSAVGGFQPEFAPPEDEERRRAALAAMLPAFLANLIGQ